MLILNKTMTEISERKFVKAYEMACKTHLKFPPDIMLHFYAYYKKATLNNAAYLPEKNEDIRSGFKANALLQVENLSPAEAKEKYVKMVEKYIGEV